jgi:hypothetical protein
MDRLEAEVKARGVTVFARIDHAAGAASVGLSRPPTEDIRQRGDGDRQHVGGTERGGASGDVAAPLK